AVLSTNLPHRFRWRVLRTEQCFLEFDELTAWFLVLRRPGEPAHFHRGSSSRKSAVSRVATPTSIDRLSAIHSARLRGRLRCADRLREIPPGPTAPTGHGGRLAGVRPPVQYALQGRYNDLPRSVGWAAVALLR